MTSDNRRKKGGKAKKSPVKPKGKPRPKTILGHVIPEGFFEQKIGPAKYKPKPKGFLAAAFLIPGLKVSQFQALQGPTYSIPNKRRKRVRDYEAENIRRRQLKHFKKVIPDPKAFFDEYWMPSDKKYRLELREGFLNAYSMTLNQWVAFAKKAGISKHEAIQLWMSP